jgi:hypothetical protein
MIYLASPYSHPDPDVMLARFEAACRHAALLMRLGHIVFSPIAHSHPVALHGKLDALSHSIWLAQDFWFIDHADEVRVLMLDGWRESRGITLEIERARNAGQLIIYDEPED